MRRHLLPFFLVLMTVSCGAAGCPKQQASTDASQTAAQHTRPGSYQGVLHGSNGEGKRCQLDLFEDEVFFLRISSPGKTEDPGIDEIGTWSISSVDSTLSLAGSSETPLVFRIVTDTLLRKLDHEGQEIPSDPGYELTRDPDLVPIEPRLLISGMYRYMADAALFVECRTGRRLAVAFEADSIALERAYLEAQDSAGEELLTTVEGRIAQRPPMEGDGTRPTLVVDHFIGIWPGDTCDRRSTNHDIGLSTQRAPGRPQ